ncbi:TniQ family protein [Streptomyces sp. NPDC050848]|uniref:TniQ family protein n=1 Tax=Streptomyces sp. NPDC050848 TaxID=3155791 RepID=UPI0033D09F41
MTAELARLPMRVRPYLGESTDSYIRRLARANHLRPSYLHGFLCGPPNWFGKPHLARLAALTGHSSEALQHALADASSPRRRRKPAPIRSGDGPRTRDESVDSFLARLAAANHVDTEELRAHLEVRMLKKTPITALREPLATVSGYPSTN